MESNAKAFGIASTALAIVGMIAGIVIHGSIEDSSRYIPICICSIEIVALILGVIGRKSFGGKFGIGASITVIMTLVWELTKMVEKLMAGN